MARNSKPSPLPPSVINSLPQRLYNAAEAFYFAGILASAKFNAGNVYAYQNATDFNVAHAEEAAIAVLTGPNRINDAFAPRIVNFAFSIELYIKLMVFLANGDLLNGHDLCKLFKQLVKAAPDVSLVVIGKYPRSADHDEFIKRISEVATVFEDWRYAYENEYLISSYDDLLEIADAFRRTMQEMHPTLRSASSRIT